MSTERDLEVREEGLTESDVAAYLRAHPEFFVEHPSLLAALKIPHPVGPAVSLIERQVEVLRSQNDQLRRKLQEFVQVARDNDHLHERVHRLTLALMGAHGASGVLETVRERLSSDFEADALALHLFCELPEGARAGVRRLDRRDPELARFENFFKSGRPLVGRLKPEQLKFLFATAAADIRSAALVPLGEHAEIGMLAVGSRDQERFHPSLDTMVLSFLGQLICEALRPYLRESATRAP
ncbi:MAG: DUF484 family protein [Gammaproteobacteria bacterium]|nr:DUF484 family protein [Gammaproteobacteria bacterium]